MHNNIDTIIKEKLEHVTVDSSYMMQDFDAIANLLPTAPVTGAGTAATAVSKSPWRFSVNTWIATIIITAVAVSTVFLIKNKNKNFQKSNTTNIQPMAANIVDSDTPVVVYEIPKDPKTAPKKWVYRMKLNFDGKNSTTLPQKKYIDLSNIKSTDNDINQKDNIEKGKTAIQAFTSKLASPSQVFTINNQQEHNITCKNGTSLQIKPNTFVNSKNETVQGNVQLELKEAYSFTDMVANNLHTVSNNSLLQSGGMIYLNAIQDMQQLGIDIKNPIQLIMPTSNRLNDMQLFNLDNGNWIPNGQMQSAKVVADISNIQKPIVWRTDNDLRKKPKFKKEQSSPNGYTISYNNYRPKVDTVFYTFAQAVTFGFVTKMDSLQYEKNKIPSWIRNQLILNQPMLSFSTTNMLVQDETTGSFGQDYITNSQNYYFNIRNFGWINCDRFINVKNKINFKVEQRLNENADANYLIFPKQKGVMSGVQLGSMSIFPNIPLNEPAVFVAFKYTNDKVLTCIQQLTTSKEPAKAEDFIELSPEQVKAKLDALGTVQ